jgi:hypothetical protein
MEFRGSLELIAGFDAVNRHKPLDVVVLSLL